MQLPPKSTPPGKLLKYGRKHISRLKANPKAKAVVPDTEKVQARLKAANLAVNDADDVVEDAEGVAGEHAYNLCDQLSALQIDVTGAVQRDYQHELYRTLCATPLATLRALELGELLPYVAKVADHIDALGKGHKLASYVATLRAAVKDAKPAATAVADATGAEKTLATQLTTAINAWFDHIDGNAGRLRAIFPRQKRRVDAFFPPVRSARLRKKQDAPAPT